MNFVRLLAVFLALAPLPALGATKPGDSTALLPGGNSKLPISIEADKLVYSDKEQKATYSGDVVVIQGDSKLTCSSMTILLEKQPTAAAGATPAPTPTPTASAEAAGDAAAGLSSSGVRHMDCSGPVTILSKSQTATGDTATYDKGQGKIWLIGHVALSSDGNVTKGDRMTYDLVSGQAVVDSDPKAGKSKDRVKGIFLPGAGDTGASSGKAKP